MLTYRKLTSVPSSFIIILCTILSGFQPVSARSEDDLKRQVSTESGDISMHFNQIDTAWGPAKSEPIRQAQGLNLKETATPTETAVVTETPVPTETPIPADIFESTEIAPNNSSSSDGEVIALSAATWYVTTTGSDSNSCTAIEFPCLTINGVIGKAADGDTIYVATGMYTGSGNEVALINKSLTLSGGWDASFTTQNSRSVIDGQNTRRGITMAGAFVVMDYFTIQNGFTSGDGGGIINYGTLSLSNSIVNSNVSQQFGGGIYNYYSGTLSLNNTTVNSNVSQSIGGGIYNLHAMTINNSTICDNTAIWGSGITNDTGTVVMNNSMISGNSALQGLSKGSGIDTGGASSFTLNNSTVSGNTNTPAINASGPLVYMEINNSTITNNTDAGISSYYAHLVIKNSILANNAPDCKGAIASHGYNLIGIIDGCAHSPTTGDLIGTSDSPMSPGLAPLQDNGGPTLTYALMSGSPAIDAGNPTTSPGSGGTACLATDQRGISRPVGTACDIGAFEGQVPAIFINITGNAGIPGATFSYIEGTLTKTVTADGSGNYSIPVWLGWSGTVTPSKLGYSFTPIKQTYRNLAVSQTSQNYTVSFATFKDSSFEYYSPNPFWSEYSTNFGTPWCRVAVCGNGGGTAGPRTYDGWIWFGGTTKPENGFVSQVITLPNGFPNLKLQFYLWIGLASAGSDASDVFTAKVDNLTVFSANATQQGLYPTYIPVLVDLSAFANNVSHKITFSTVTTGQVVNFNLDDVSLVNVTFFDVPSDYWALQFIERLYNAGITGGCSVTPLNYCPDSTVTRAQMAVFLLKGMHGSSYTPPTVGVSTGFTDVATDYWAAAWIKQLAAEGITGGCGTGVYCPDATVTRAQMAIFLLRAKHGSSYSPPAATGVFTDVPMGYWADKWIEQLAVEGVTSGCGAGVYCPDSSVTRAQMAVFLVKAFNLP